MQVFNLLLYLFDHMCFSKVVHTDYPYLKKTNIPTVYNGDVLQQT